MKVRFYRGPWDGKTKEVADHEHVVLVSTMNQKFLFEELFDSSNPTAVAPTYKTYRYRRTNYMHPDGSVFFEWDKPRGTKIK